MTPEYPTPPDIAPELVSALYSAFINRTDRYPHQQSHGKYIQVRAPLSPALIRAHLLGQITLGAYALNPRNAARWLCLDADTDAQFTALRETVRKLQTQQVTGYLETSRRGGHLWLFTPPLSGYDIRRLGKQLMTDYHLSPEIELYPKQDTLHSGAGSFVRLPFGVHRKSGKRYHFITPAGEPLAPTIREQIPLFAQPRRLPSPFITGLLARAPQPSPQSPTARFENLPQGQGRTLSETLKATITVERFVSQFVALDEKGIGLCPFHDDHEPSFQVNAEDNYWFCYACGTGGSIIDFWMRWREQQGADGRFTPTLLDLRALLL